VKLRRRHLFKSSAREGGEEGDLPLTICLRNLVRGGKKATERTRSSRNLQTRLVAQDPSQVMAQKRERVAASTRPARGVAVVQQNSRKNPGWPRDKTHGGVKGPWEVGGGGR